MQASTCIERDKYLSPDEVQTLRSYCLRDARRARLRDAKLGGTEGHPCIVRWMIVDLALLTGLRVSEIAKIKHGDIDLDRGFLRAWRHKRRKPARELIAVGSDLEEHLREFMAWKEQEGLPTGPRTALLIGQRGPLTARGLQQSVKVAMQEAGLPEDYSVHSLRHTLAVYLLEKTGNLRAVQKQLGHSSPAVTAAMYADVRHEVMQEALSGVYGR